MYLALAKYINESSPILSSPHHPQPFAAQPSATPKHIGWIFHGDDDTLEPSSSPSSIRFIHSTNPDRTLTKHEAAAGAGEEPDDSRKAPRFVSIVASSSSSLASSAGSVSSIGGGEYVPGSSGQPPEGAQESSRLINAPGADSWASYNRQLRSLGFEAVPVIAGSSRLGEPTLVDGRKLFETCMSVLQEYGVRNRQLLTTTSSVRRDSPKESSKLKELSRSNWKLQQEVEKLRRELDASVVEHSSNSLTSGARTKELERVKSQQSGEIRRLHHQCQRQEMELDRMRKTVLAGSYLERRHNVQMQMQKVADDEEMRRKRDKEFAEKVRLLGARVLNRLGRFDFINASINVLAVKSVCSGDKGPRSQGSLQLLHELAAV
ncbi:hypothetical protein FOZ63_001733, partial [Perkinsus olseni]